LTRVRYAKGALATVEVSSTRAAIASLLEKYRQGGKAENIIHIVHKVPDGAPVFTPGTELAEEFAELSPKLGEKVIGKNFPSSFAKTDLHEYLESIGVKKIVLVGYMVSYVLSGMVARADADNRYCRRMYASRQPQERVLSWVMMSSSLQMVLVIGIFREQVGKRLQRFVKSFDPH
jgi:hypothetical protein